MVDDHTIFRRIEGYLGFKPASKYGIRLVYVLDPDRSFFKEHFACFWVMVSAKSSQPNGLEVELFIDLIATYRCWSRRGSGALRNQEVA